MIEKITEYLGHLLKVKKYYLKIQFIYSMKKIYLFLILNLILFSTKHTHAQLKAIKVDSTTGVPNEPLPFDQSFVLKFPILSNSRIAAVEYVPHIGKKPIGESIQIRSKRRQKIGKNGYEIPIITSKYLRNSSEDNKRYLNVTFPLEHYLKPSTNYSFILNQFTHEEFEMFMAYHNNVIAPNPVQLAKAKQIYDKLREKEVATFDDPTLYYNFHGTTIDPTLIQLNNKYIGMYKGAIDPNLALGVDFTTYNVAEVALNGYVAGLVSDALFQGHISIKSLIDFFSSTSALTSINDEFQKKYFIDNTVILNRVIFLYNLSPINYKNLLKGLISIDCARCNVLNDSQITERQENIKKTIQALYELKQLNDILVSRGGIPNIAPASVNIPILIGELNTSMLNITNMVGSYHKIEEKLTKHGYLDATLIKGGNTYIYNFDTRNKLSIAPDFGIVTTRIGNDGNNPYPFVPYIGFHVNLRPLNRDVPFRSYKKSILHRLSFLAGFSLVSVGNGPKLVGNAGADSTRSFFDKSTLLTGIGFRLGNAARITFGSMWYFKYIKNPIQQSSIAYTGRSLNFWPFIGLTIDLAPKSIFEGIDTIFATSPRKFNSPPTDSN